MTAITARKRKAWRSRFKRRLRAAVEKVWGSAHGAITAGAAAGALYRWLDSSRTELPRADDLWRLCEAGSISVEHLIFDRGDMLVMRKPTIAGLGVPGDRWTADDAYTFALLLRGYFHSIAVDQLRRRRADIELIESTDPKSDTAGNELLARVALEDHAAAVEARVRDRIDREIDARLAALFRTAHINAAHPKGDGE